MISWISHKERIDIAITIGTTPLATSLVRRHLADWDNVLVASPAYFAARGKPATIEDLARHDFIALPPWHHPADVMSGPGGEHVRLQVKPRVTSNNQHAIKQLALAGVGLSFQCRSGDCRRTGRRPPRARAAKWSTARVERGRADAAACDAAGESARGD